MMSPWASSIVRSESQPAAVHTLVSSVSAKEGAGVVVDGLTALVVVESRSGEVLVSSTVPEQEVRRNSAETSAAIAVLFPMCLRRVRESFGSAAGDFYTSKSPTWRTLLAAGSLPPTLRWGQFLCLSRCQDSGGG